MFGTRDVVWSLAICAALTLLMQCRPAWSARRFIERESKAGFEQAYAGQRFASGEIISAAGKGVHIDPLAPMVTLRRLEITAERLSWTGDKAEFVVRHAIAVEGADPQGDDASQEIHVRIEKQGSGWTYTLFEVRGRGSIADPNTGNPWARALAQS
jgi:hypothetical protein